MKTIELRCPSCERELEVDLGFTGGVCRCSDCGTLMSVPSRSSGQAEAVERTDRPARPSRPDRPAGADAGQAPPAEAQPEPEAEADDPLAALQQQASGETAGSEASKPKPESDTTTYTTASGQQIEVGRERRIPTARKRKFTRRRVMTYSAVALVTLALTGGVIFAAVHILKQRDVQTRGETFQPTREFSYNAGSSTNPFNHQQVNVLGLPLSTGETAIIVDASETSGDWLSLVKSALAHGLTRSESKATYELIYATTDGPRAMHRQALAEAADIERSAIADFQGPVPAKGEANLTASFEAAAGLKPDQIVLITGRGLDSDRVGKLEAALNSLDAVMVDVVYLSKKETGGLGLIEPEEPPVEALTDYKQGGFFRWIEPNQLEMWYESGR